MDPLILVAPLVGAWIEITLQSNLRYADEVAPLVGAWIEIIIIFSNLNLVTGRSSRGSVD